MTIPQSRLISQASLDAFISQSALDKKITHDFTTLFSIITFTYADDLSDHAEKLAKTCEANASKFIKHFDLNDKEWKAALRMMYRKHNPSENEKMNDHLKRFAKSFRIVKADITRETDISTNYLKLINDMAVVCNSESEAAFNRIIKNIGWLQEPDVAMLYEADVQDQSDILTDLKKVVKKITGKVGTEISAEDRANAKGSDALKEYNRLRRELNAVPKAFIANLVRSSGKQYLPVSKILTELAKAGIKEHTIPKGFKGFIDDSQSFFTEGGLKLLQTPSGEVIMNPKYDPKTDNAYVCTSQPAFAAKPTRIYTEDFRKSKNKAKYEATRELNQDLTKFRTKWLSVMKRGYTSLEGFLAHLTEIMFQTSARIGNKNNKNDGLTTLKVKHLKKSGKTRTLSYLGKKAQRQTHVITGEDAVTNRLVKFIDDCAAGKRPNDLLFDFDDKMITSVQVNNFLRNDLGMPQKVTIHKFRTARGTHMASKILSKHPFGKKTPTQKEAADWLKEEFETIAERLGHFSKDKVTVTTAIQNYIDPSVMEDFFRDIDVRPPAAIQRAIDSAKD